MPFCAQCGSELSASDQFCRQCGHQSPTSPAQQSSPTPPVPPPTSPAPPPTYSQQAYQQPYQQPPYQQPVYPPQMYPQARPITLPAWVPTVGKQLGLSLLVNVGVVVFTWLASYLFLLILLTCYKNTLPAVDAGDMNTALGTHPGIVLKIVYLYTYLAQHIPLVASVDSAMARVHVVAWLPISLFSLIPAVLLWVGARVLAGLVRPANTIEYLRLILLFGAGYLLIMLLGLPFAAVNLGDILQSTPLGREIPSDIFNVPGVHFYCGPSILWTMLLGLLWGVIWGGLGIAHQWQSEVTRYQLTMFDRAMGILHGIRVSGRLLVWGLIIGVLAPFTWFALHAQLQDHNIEWGPMIPFLFLAPATGLSAFGAMMLSTLQFHGVGSAADGMVTNVTLSLAHGATSFDGSNFTSVPAPAWVWLFLLAPILLHLIGGVFTAKREISLGRAPNLALLALRYTGFVTLWLLFIGWASSGAMSGTIPSGMSDYGGSSDYQHITVFAGHSLLTLLPLGALFAFIGSFLGIGWQYGWDIRAFTKRPLSMEQIARLTRALRAIVFTACVVFVLFLVRQVVIAMPTLNGIVLLPNYQLTVSKIVGLVAGFAIVILLANLGFNLESAMVEAEVWAVRTGLQARLWCLGAAWLAAFIVCRPLLGILFQRLGWLYYTLFGGLFVWLVVRGILTLDLQRLMQSTPAPSPWGPVQISPTPPMMQTPTPMAMPTMVPVSPETPAPPAMSTPPPLPASPPMAAPVATAPDVCSRCGAPRTPNARFCKLCGTAVTTQTTEVEQ